jgi:tRNA-specific 2-thiouridylase
MANLNTGKRRAVVAMSGGVDSSVAAALLARDGYEVIGVTMRLFDAPFEGAGRLSKSCCSLEDVEDARATCRVIGARHYYLNFEKEFQEHVIDYFVGEYEKGRTPHPCLACNDRLKFDFLMRRAELMDADIVATGHYARVTESGGSFHLLRGKDPAKDQAYVLYTLTQEKLAKLRLPVGEFSKPEIRALAAQFGLPVADKPDSQDICFIPAGNYREFVERRLTSRMPGVIRTADGAVLGEHNGVHGFTIGQRKGLPVTGTGKPVFVTRINATNGEVTVGHAQDLMQTELYASGVSWISGVEPDGPVRAEARIRYNGREELATVIPAGEWAKIIFDRPMRAVTPGQAVVFFDGDEVLGGGLIELEAPVDISEPEEALARPY